MRVNSTSLCTCKAWPDAGQRSRPAEGQATSICLSLTTTRGPIELKYLADESQADMPECGDMSCPRCNGTSRDPITPNFWRCTSIVTSPTTQHLPGPAADQWGMVTVGVPVQCGFEYQEVDISTIHGDHPLKCWCGLFAIGECLQCGSSFCGTPGHRNVIDGRNLCGVCARFEQEVARQLLASTMRDYCQQRVEARLSGFIHYLSTIKQPAARFAALAFQSAEAIARLNDGGYVAPENPSRAELDSAFLGRIRPTFNGTRFQTLLSASPRELIRKVDGDFLRQEIAPIVSAQQATVPVTGIRRGLLFAKEYTISKRSGWRVGPFWVSSFTGGDNGDWDTGRSQIFYLIPEDFTGIYHLSGSGQSSIRGATAPSPWGDLSNKLAGQLIMELVGESMYEWQE